jgi:hypothetical protein
MEKVIISLKSAGDEGITFTRYKGCSKYYNYLRRANEWPEWTLEK